MNSTNAYTEDQLVEQPRMLSGLFAELGWQMVSAFQNRRWNNFLQRLAGHAGD